MNLKIQEEIQKGNIDSIKCLLDKNGLPLDSNWTDYYLLKTALRYKQNEIATLFLQKGARVNKSYIKSKDSTPLHLAIHLGCPKIVDILLSKGASVIVKNNNNETPLILAALMGKNELVDRLLSVVTYENVYNEEGLAHIHIACMRNRVDVVKRFLQNGTDINYIVKLSSYFWPGYTPLHFAVHYQCVETVKLLVDCGANITAKNSNGLTPLHLAFKNQNEAIIDLILAAQLYATENPENSEGLSHFHIACTRNNPKVVEDFLQRGADIGRYTCIDASNWDFYSPLCFAIEFECIDVIKLLLKYNPKLCGVTIGRAYEKSNAAINQLIFSKRKAKVVDPIKEKNVNIRSSINLQYVNINEIEIFAQQSFNNSSAPYKFEVNARNWRGYTPLHIAVEGRSKDTIKSLLQNGADVTVKDNQGKTPLHLAFETKQIEILDLLLLALINLKENVTDNKGLSHFHISSTRHNLIIIKHFLKSGVDVNSCVSLESAFWPGYTALHFACAFAHSDVVRLLLERGADIMIKNGLGLTPLELTFKKSKIWWADELNSRLVEIFELLLKARESRINAFTDNGLSLLHLACAKDDLDAVKRLLNDRSINQPVYLPNWSGRTPLHFATFFNSVRVIDYLLDHNADATIEDAEGFTPLDLGLQKNDGIVSRKMFIPSEKLLAYKGDVNSDAGLFHFYMACRLSYPNVVEYFVNRGIGANQLISARRVYSSDKVCTPLQVVLKNERCEESLVQLLLKHGADVNKADTLMETPLHNVIFANDSRMLKYLIKEGADPNTQNIFGETPLHLFCKRIVDQSIMSQVIEVVNILLESGTDINIENDEGDTPLMAYAQDFNENLNLIIELLKHVKRLQIIGCHISDQNKKIYHQLLTRCEQSGKFKEIDYVSRCKTELERMKAVKLDNYTTLRDIIFKEPNKLALHVENDTFRDILRDRSDNHLRNTFPIYGFVLELKFREGLLRRKLLELAKVSLKLISGSELNDACSENITRFLSNDDFKNVIKTIVPFQSTKTFKAIKNCPFLTKVKDVL